MILKAEKTSLLLRINNYKNKDFIEEHNKIIQKYGYVWMLKAGRKLVQSKLDTVMNDSAVLILKAPKKTGGGYFYTSINEYCIGKERPDMIYPDYYKELIDDEVYWQVESLDGTWLKIGEIKSLPEEKVSKLKLLSNGKLVCDVVGTTMSATLYVKSDVDL